jgi:hypothetical protein
MNGRVLDLLRGLHVDTRVVTDYVRHVHCYVSVTRDSRVNARNIKQELKAEGQNRTGWQNVAPEYHRWHSKLHVPPAPFERRR